MAASEDASLLTRLVSELQDMTRESDTVEAVLKQVLEVAPDADHASVTVRRRRHGHETLAASSSVAAQADRLQYELGEGPCVSAADESDWFRSGDVKEDERWPVWGREAARLGLSSMLCLSLSSRGEPAGALNLYSHRAGAFDDVEQRELALLYAAHVSGALTSVRTTQGLESALGTRHEIGMAQGVLIERFGLTPETSLGLLKRLSNEQNRKLRELAAEIVADAVGNGRG